MKKYDWGSIKSGADNEYLVINKEDEICGFIRHYTPLKLWVLFDIDILTAAQLLRDIADFMDSIGKEAADGGK